MFGMKSMVVVFLFVLYDTYCEDVSRVFIQILPLQKLSV